MVTGTGWQDRAGHYPRGLMLDGRRKPIQPMAARPHGPHEQALNHFVTNSPWDVTPVRRRIAERVSEALAGPAIRSARLGRVLPIIGARSKRR
jgi:SRSO17 transposase